MHRLFTKGYSLEESKKSLSDNIAVLEQFAKAYAVKDKLGLSSHPADFLIAGLSDTISSLYPLLSSKDLAEEKGDISENLATLSKCKQTVSEMSIKKDIDNILKKFPAETHSALNVVMGLLQENFKQTKAEVFKCISDLMTKLELEKLSIDDLPPAASSAAAAKK